MKDQQNNSERLAGSRFFALDQFLSTVIDDANIWINVLDANSNVLIWNKAAEQISGYARSEVVGHGRIWEWLYPDAEYRGEITAKAAAIIKRGESVTDFETTIRTKEGKDVVISWHSRSLRNEDGTPMGSIAVGRDITEQKEFIDRLRESEQRYRTLAEELQLVHEHTEKKIRVRTHQLTETISELRHEIKERKLSEEARIIASRQWQATFDAMDDAVWLLDTEGRVLRSNRAGKQLFGGENAIKGRPCYQIVHDRKTFPADCAYRRMTESRRREETEITRDGRTFRDIVDPVFDDHGTIIGAVHTLSDISERRQAEEFLRESEERFRNLFEQSIDGIIIHDLEGTIIDANPQALKLLGFSRRELLRLDLPNLHPDQAQEDAGAVMETLHRGGKNTVEIDFLRKDGTVFPAEVSYSVFHIRNEPLVQSIFRDISKRREAERKLRKERDLAELYLDIAEVIMVVIEADQKVRLINRKGCDVLGYREEEIVGRNWIDSFIPQASRRQAKKLFSQLMKGRLAPHKYEENHLLTKTGDERLIAWHNTILTDDRGTIYGTLSSGIDITRQRQAITSLKEREELYRKLLETSPDAIIITSVDGDITMVNQRAAELFGPLEAHRDGRWNIEDLIDSKDRVRARKNGKRLLRQGIVRHIPYTMHKQDRSTFIAELSSAVLTDEADRPTGCINIIRDITMRRQAEEVLNLYQRLLQFTRDGVYRYTFDDGKIIYGNQGLVDILDLDCVPHELEGRYMKDLLIYTEQEGTIRARLAAEGEIHGYEYQFKTLKGEYRWVIHDSFIVTDPVTGEKIVEAVVRDITAYKEAERKLLRYQDQLRSLASKLVLAEEAERRRLATLLHDTIGSTMALSKIKLGAMRGTLATEEQRDELDFIRRLLEQAIQSSRSLTFELSPPVLYDLGLEPALEWLLEETQKQHGITCSFTTDNQPKPLNEDVRILLFQAVREILVNVAKHAQATQITATCEISGGEFRIVVEDDGIGFDPSRTVSSAPYKGGFGLFSLRERLRQLGGHFQIESAPDMGTRVSLSAPLKDS